MNIILYKHSSFFKKGKRKKLQTILTSQSQHLASRIELCVEARKSEYLVKILWEEEKVL